MVIWTQWAIDNEPAKRDTVENIASMARSPLSIDHARERAREIAKEWPEFLALLKKELENESKTN